MTNEEKKPLNLPGKKSHRYPIKATYQDGGARSPELDAFVVFDEEQPNFVFIETSIDSRIALDFGMLMDAISAFSKMLAERFSKAIGDAIGSAVRMIIPAESIDALNAPPEVKKRLRMMFGHGDADDNEK